MSLSIFKPLLLAYIFTATANAQVTLFEDDFSEGLANWINDTPWHLASPTNSCVLSTNPTPGHGAMARMGDLHTGSYCGFHYFDTNPGTASLTMMGSVNIPPYADAPYLEYKSYTDTEMCGGWDFHWVMISADHGASWQTLTGDCQFQQEWHDVRVDLSDWKGQSIRIRFLFDSVDAWSNSGVGWLVDDVAIRTEACTSTNFCIGAPNSVSATGASLGYVGSKRIHVNDFSLTMTGAPPGQFAHFFYGPFETQTPVASGFLCVATDHFGFRRIYPGGQIDANGSLIQPIDFTALFSQYTILPGESLKFQCWYRDQVNGQSTSNFSDGLSVTFCE